MKVLSVSSILDDENKAFHKNEFIKILLRDIHQISASAVDVFYTLPKLLYFLPELFLAPNRSDFRY